MAKVLFIEDDPSWQEILKDLLDTANHDALYAPTLNLAILALNNRENFDVIIFDLHLPLKAVNENPEKPKSPFGKNPFVWLDALIEGIKGKKIKLPQIIIVTAIKISTRDVSTCFTKYRGTVYHLFDKNDFDDQEFMDSIKDAAEYSLPSKANPVNYWHKLVNALLMTFIAITIFGILLFSISQIPDPDTQQTFLKIGGALLIVVAIFITMFSQNTKIEDIVESIIKVWGK